MNGGKRFSSGKGGGGLRAVGGKPKDSPSSSKTDSDSDFLSSIPVLKQLDNVRLLPKYSAILGRAPDDGVNMDDLDQLQLDLERLFSTCAVRNRYLRNEIESIDRVEERRDKKGKTQASLKRKKPDEKSKFKDPKNGNRPFKKHYPLADHSLLGAVRNEIPKINLPKNDTSDRFWATVEPFCADITPAHAMFLDKLIEECSEEIDLKIPDLGEHYADEWNESAINSEAEMSKSPTSGDLKRNGLNAMVDTLSNPLTQRLLATLMEERVMSPFPNVTNKLKPTDFDLNILKSSPRSALCMDRRLKKDLVEQGIISVEDLAKMNSEDEILEEIKKCKQELSSVVECNLKELTRLKEIVNKDLKRQEIKSALDKVDQQLLECYNDVMVAKQKVLQDIAKGEETDTQIMKNHEIQADLLLKQQSKLQEDLNQLHSIPSYS